MLRVCHAFLHVHRSLVVFCWERDVLLTLLYGKFYCVSVTFPCGGLGQVWYLIVLIPELWFLTYSVCCSSSTFSSLGSNLRLWHSQIQNEAQ